ncbi:SAV_2336 N-terminal domain-related protein, partial [Streptomyces sp. NPDC052164]|uniref:SAV_2336 N-terminal domain-related protein n=1 Tax=Streptomyces sp. NPDC052164 TaxID=3155529 RepID=UPI0034251EA0
EKADAGRALARLKFDRLPRAPGPRALPGTQPLARALRPLRGYRDHRYRTVADIEATVRLTAESGVLDVVARPEQELRHTAFLLVDDSPSMRLWQPLAREVKRLLERAGVFRAVRVHRFALGDGHRPTGTPRTESPVTFVLTDGVDEAWQSPAADRFIETWGRAGPLTVLPPLPRRLWRGTAFDAQPHPVVAEQPFAPARELRILDPLSGLPVRRTADRPAVPVVALTPSSLSAWARLLTRPGTPSLVDIAMFDAVGGASRAAGPPPSTHPRHRLERFRASFSPDAYRLAVRLSAIRPLSLPVIQLVRIASLPGTSPTAVAEVLLGDLLRPAEDGGPGDLRLPTAVGDGPADPLYDFRPGIRDLLASGLSVEQSIEVVEAVGGALEPYLGRMPDFAALLDDPRGDEHRSAGTSAFAVLVSPVLDRLYGRATPVAEVPGAHRVPLRFTVFGPHLAWRGTEPVPMGSSRQKAVLVALLLRRGRAVADTVLVDSVWGEQAPDDRTQAARSYVSRLRRALASSGIEIEDTADGYRLPAPGGTDEPDLDLTVAERLHEEARTARAAGDLAGARRALTDALARTEGPPLDGITGPFATDQATRLAEWRLALLEFRIELDLEAGDHAAIIPELDGLTQAHPLNERLRAHLMLALYRSGRQAEALAVYADIRRLLHDEIGLDPGPELTRLQTRILQGADASHPAVAPRPRPVLATSPVTAPPVDGVRFAVLGPVRAWRGGEPLASGSPQQRALLTALLLRDGRTATASELIDAIWGEEPPQQALAALRTYASRLRKVLDPGVLISEAGGYALRIPADALDLHTARRLATEAEQARINGDLPQSRALITEVLALWDGEALTSVPGPYAENQRTRLEEWRLELTETRLDLNLESGFHAEAISELTALTAAHPLREQLRGLLMIALYRSGRQAEALAVYADTRRLLADELGVDPRPELAQLQQRILQADEELARPAGQQSPAEETPWPPPPAVPHQLPAPVHDFTGRQHHLLEITEHLLRADGSVMAITALGGLGGVGKTTLAVQAAHTVRTDFPDGQLYVDLQGAGFRAAAAEAVLGSFLRALGTADSAIPDTLDERAALYRSSLEGRRVLVLLDNARDAAQIRPLLPGTAGCAALVTSRVRMVDLAGA